MRDRGSLQELIDAHKDHFTEAQQRIAEFLLRDPARVAFMNARQLGEAVGVSESSVIRFAYTAGFDGYRGLQSAAQQVVNHHLALPQRYLQNRPLSEGDVVQTAIRSTIQNLQGLEQSVSNADVQRAAARLASSRRSYVVGTRAAAGLSLIASSALSQLLHNCIQLSYDAGEAIDQLVGTGPEDAMIAISFRRYAFRTLRIAKYSHAQGAFVVGITDSLFSPLREHSDVLLVGDVEAPTYTYSLSAPLCIIDALVLALCQHMGDGAAALIEEWEETYGYFHLLDGMPGPKEA